MKRICAWCGSEINPSRDTSASDISRADSICLSCAHVLLARIPHDLGKFLDEIAVPILLVDADGTVRKANSRAKFLLGKEEKQIVGFAGGDVFECAYARLPEGCGRTIHCSGCAIRRAIMMTHATGVGASRIPASLIHRPQNDPEDQEINFVISTEKFRDKVMLRIDYVHP